MKYLLRFSAFMLFLFGLTVASFGQNRQPPDDGAAAILAAGSPGYVRVTPNIFDRTQPAHLQPVDSSMILDFPANAVSSRAIFGADSGAASSVGGNGTAANNLGIR